jgi:hypothetical protein
MLVSQLKCSSNKGSGDHWAMLTLNSAALMHAESLNLIEFTKLTSQKQMLPNENVHPHLTFINMALTLRNIWYSVL